MLRATDNKYVGIYTEDVKRLLLTTIIEMGDYTIDGIMSAYNVFLLIDRLRRGDVVLFVTDGLESKVFVGRVISDLAKERVRSMAKNSEIKIFRIERMTADFDVVELKINH
jgi:hypothetical protein